MMKLNYLYVGYVIAGIPDWRVPVFWRLDNMFSICHKPQQSRPACRNRLLKSFQNWWNDIYIEPKQRTFCTFKCGYLPCLCFWQAFLTSVSSQGQCDAAAAQQKANLLTSCILGTKDMEKFMNVLERSSESKWELQERKKEKSTAIYLKVTAG